MSSVDDKIREARKELEQLQSAAHPTVIAQKQADYLEALRRERGFVEARRAAALALGDKHERIPSPIKRGEYVNGELTGCQAAAKLGRRVADIDAELDRVAKLG